MNQDAIVDRVDIGDWCTLLQADSRELFPDSHIFESIVTDPPYGMEYQSNYRQERYDPIVGDTSTELLQWTCARTFLHSAYVFCRWDFVWQATPPRSVITWVKNNWGMGDLEHEHARQTEQILFYRGPQHDFPNGRPTDYVYASRTGNNSHSTEKPVPLLADIVSWTRGVVTDPFMGSGTTALACWRKQRKFIGVEIRRDYFETAVERVTSEAGHGPLFEAESSNSSLSLSSLFGGSP